MIPMERKDVVAASLWLSLGLQYCVWYLQHFLDSKDRSFRMIAIIVWFVVIFGIGLAIANAINKNLIDEDSAV